MAKLLVLVVGMLTAQAAWAQGYRCQIISQPTFFYDDVTWDGTAPVRFELTHDGQAAAITVQEIGLAGHTEYLFSFIVGNKTVLAVSQKSGLADYNLNWRNADQRDTQTIISLACRLGF